LLVFHKNVSSVDVDADFKMKVKKKGGGLKFSMSADLHIEKNDLQKCLTLAGLKILTAKYG